MDHMFCNCSFLKELNLHNFNTKKVTNMEKMFYNCKSLIKLNLNNFEIKKVKTMEYMFCFSKFNGDISKWDPKNVESAVGMFSNSPLQNNPPKWYNNIT